MPSDNFIKNITSKDIKLSKDTIIALIKTADIKHFEELCKKSEFIFPFLKERIINDFVKLINKEDLKTIFEFSKIYSSDFEDLIVESWLKFAQEDLTDEILDLFEKGSDEQKAYCAKYFCFIKDSLALDYLKSNLKSDFEPLQINCALALKEFKDEDTVNEMKEIILKSDDEFEKIKSYTFLSVYGGAENIKFILNNAFKSPFIQNIISTLFDFNDLNFIKTIINENTLTRVFSALIEGYPEDISLNTVIYYQIYDFINILEKFNNQYAKNLLLLAKKKFEEYTNNDIYLFDLDKNTKDELKRILDKLNSIEMSFDLEEELKLYNEKPYRFLCALEVIKEYKLKDFAHILSELFNKQFLKEEFMANVMETLKEIESVNSINLENVDNISNLNIKALVKSYL